MLLPIRRLVQDPREEKKEGNRERRSPFLSRAPSRQHSCRRCSHSSLGALYTPCRDVAVVGSSFYQKRYQPENGNPFYAGSPPRRPPCHLQKSALLSQMESSRLVFMHSPLQTLSSNFGMHELQTSYSERQIKPLLFPCRPT
jgi:hypothetical protein